jgi:phosphomannomutase
LLLVTLRTSGTEPKIKFYTEIAGNPGEKRNDVVSKLHSFVTELINDMLQPDLHGLGRP